MSHNQPKWRKDGEIREALRDLKRLLTVDTRILDLLKRHNLDTLDFVRAMTDVVLVDRAPTDGSVNILKLILNRAIASKGGILTS